MDRTDFEHRVLDTIGKYNMLGTGSETEKKQNVVVGLSGGADSVSLLYSLYRLRKRLGIELYAAHVNHHIRGKTALRDQLFCEKLCGRLGICIDLYDFDVPALAKEQGKGLEECGRECRYRAFEETAGRIGGAKIATAHTLSDSCETVLFNIARGCGLSGLTGIPAVRGNIIRPLISLSREDIEDYCSENALEYMTDETNSDTAYTRNLIRHEIIPAFRRVNSDFTNVLERMSAIVADELEYIEASADRLFSKSYTEENELDLGMLKTAGKALSKRAIIRLIKERAGISPEFRHISIIWGLIENGNTGAVELSKQYTSKVTHDRLFIEETSNSRPKGTAWQIPFKAGTITLPNGRQAQLLVCDRNKYDENVKSSSWLFKNALNYDIIQNIMEKECITIRNRREGDRIALAGRHCTSRIKKLLCDAHISPEKREMLALLEADGQIIWLEGFGAAEDYQIKAGTKQVLYINLT